MLGRILRTCLRFCNEQFADQVTVLLHKDLEDDMATLYQAFLAAAHGDMAQALCIAPSLLQYGPIRIKAVASDARLRSQAYPSSALLKHVAEQRNVKLAQFDSFIYEVTRRISANAPDLSGVVQAR
jgi:hypothetical protein